MNTETSLHRKTWDQIPWIVNGTLPSDELQAAAEHLQSCDDCREELEFQRHVARSLGSRNESGDMDPQRSWQLLRARIEASDAAPPDAAGGSDVVRHGLPRWTGWLVAAMVVQAIGLGVLGVALWSKPAAQPLAPSAVYRTLSAPEPSVAATATIRVVFAGDMSVDHMQTLLRQSGLQVVSGPTSAGVWSLGPDGDSNHAVVQTALLQLRGNPEVHFAEAIGGTP